VPRAAIVGYTNAGKSSLLNALTAASVHAENTLFATLDPTTRRLLFAQGQTLLLTDTVGFIRNLPHGLVEAFRSTLEEASQADLLIHVADASDVHVDAHIATTLQVLCEIGANDVPRILVLNKSTSPSAMPRRLFCCAIRGASRYRPRLGRASTGWWRRYRKHSPGA
jgi:GTP-binding protein HflX